MSDLLILAALREKKHFKNLAQYLPKEMVDPSTSKIINWYTIYFNLYPDHEVVDLNILATLINIRMAEDVTRKKELLDILEHLSTAQIPIEAIENTQNQIEELVFSGRAGAILTKFNSGEDIDVTYEMLNLATKTRERMNVASGKKWADDDILKYLEADADDSGFQITTFTHLQRSIKGLHEGHNVMIAAPTNKGKTSLLCKLAVDFAKQAKDMEHYKDSCILYLVNESLAETITPRIYTTALAITRDKAFEMAKAGTLVPEYCKIVGKRDMIRLVNIHGMNVAQVARVIEAHKPFMVITDMTGRIRANSSKGDSNEVRELEEVWNSMRELSATLRFIHIGTAQISAEGMNELYPPITALQWSKVGIQTTLDLIIMLGAINTDGFQNTRGISTPKNKLIRQGAREDNKFEVVFDPELNLWQEGTIT